MDSLFWNIHVSPDVENNEKGADKGQNNKENETRKIGQQKFKEKTLL